MARLLSVNVGSPREVTWKGKTVRTAVWKLPVAGRSMVRKLNIEGDAQADLAGHGGEQRAVLVYQMDSYHYWERFLERNDFDFGQFGENFTVEGLADDEVCIGDRYRIGGAVFEVTQPRVTCYRVGIRMNEPRMPALLVAHHRPGFYLRVLEEGSVAAGDEIVKIADGPEKVTVAEIDALLYLPGHPREPLQRALRIPALSKGWQTSFEALLQQSNSEAIVGNPGLVAEEQTPAWPGFREMRVEHIHKESASVTSFFLKPIDGTPLPRFLPGQFVALRLPVEADKPAIVRSYSLSDMLASDRFRISVKRELDGAGSSFLLSRIREGDVLEVSAPRGEFTLRSGKNAVVLVSAGIGATPVISMLDAIVAENSKREVWWIYGARNGSEHPFAQEVRSLLKQLPRARSHILYSRPESTDHIGSDFDTQGRIDVTLLQRIGVPSDGEFYLCGPPSFLQKMHDGLQHWGVPAEHVHTEIFGALDPITPGMAAAAHAPHVPSGVLGQGPAVSFARSGITTAWSPTYRSLLELAEACDVPTRWSCRSGVCHTCITGLVSGSVAYDPEPLEAPTPGNVLVCCSQPKTNVVLDL